MNCILDPTDVIYNAKNRLKLFSTPVDIQFSDITGLKKTRNITTFGSMTSTDGVSPQQTLTLKRGIFTIPSPLTITNLIESAFWNNRLLRRDILITTLNSEQEPTYAWLITNAYLEGWEWNGLNAGSNELLIESMSFKYTRINPIQLKFTKQ